MGTRNCNALTAKEKAALVLWIKEQSEDTRTYGALAQVATEALGFAVTESNIQGWWNAVNGPRRTYPVRKDGRDAAAKLRVIEDWCDRIEDWTTGTDRRLHGVEHRVSEAFRQVKCVAEMVQTLESAVFKLESANQK